MQHDNNRLLECLQRPVFFLRESSLNQECRSSIFAQRLRFVGAYLAQPRASKFSSSCSIPKPGESPKTIQPSRWRRPRAWGCRIL